MSILEAARRHFGPRWKPSVRVIGGPGQFKQKLAELQKEIRHLQRAYERLQLADLQQPDRGMVTPDVRVISPRVEEELATLHGWTVSLVETTFSLIMLERGRDEEDGLRAEASHVAFDQRRADPAPCRDTCVNPVDVSSPEA